MSEVCETVNVVGTDGKKLLINKVDFDEAPEGTFTLHKDQDIPAAPEGAATEVVAEAPAPPVETPAPVEPVKETAPVRLVSKETVKGKDKFFVTDDVGTKIEAEGIAATGYASEVEAWNAVLALG